MNETQLSQSSKCAQNICKRRRKKNHSRCLRAAQTVEQWGQDRPRSPWSRGGPLTPRLRTVNGGPACADRGILLCGCCRSAPPAPGVRLCDTMSSSPPGSPVLRSPRPGRQLLITCWRPAGEGGGPAGPALKVTQQTGREVRTLAPAPAQGSLRKRAVWRAPAGPLE